MRPSVLILDPSDARRQLLSQALAALGYEVVPAATSEEGLRFAEGLGLSVILADADLPAVADGSLLDKLAVHDHTMQRTLLLLGEPENLGDLPEDVLFLPVEGLGNGDLLHRVHLVLVGREIGVEPDVEVESLVGELALLPMPGLIRSLHRCLLTGEVRFTDGTIALERGEVIAARAGQAAGIKAFCRLARRSHGPFHIHLEQSALPPEIGETVDELLLRALEEAQVPIPDPHTRIRVVHDAAAPSERLSTHHDLLVEMMSRCETVGELLDALPATDARMVQALLKMVETGAATLEKPRPPVTVVTDSTSDLPPDLAAQHDIRVVPLSVVFGEDVLRDGVDIQSRDFYELLRTSPDHPSTRPPTQDLFFANYHDLVAEQDILSVHISEKLSQTIVHARQAAMQGAAQFELPESRKGVGLEIVDTRTVSMGVGMLALFGARMAQRGEKVYTIARRLEKMRDRIHMLFAVDTLEFLQRGGRIGKAQAFVGKLLDIKPILGVQNGEVVPVDKVRGGRKAHPRIVELFKQRVDPKKPVIVTVAHAQAPVWAESLRVLLEKSFDIRELIRADIGPVVGTHAGPGCVGAVIFQPEDDELELILPLGE